MPVAQQLTHTSAAVVAVGSSERASLAESKPSKHPEQSTPLTDTATIVSDRNGNASPPMIPTGDGSARETVAEDEVAEPVAVEEEEEDRASRGAIDNGNSQRGMATGDEDRYGDGHTETGEGKVGEHEEEQEDLVQRTFVLAADIVSGIESLVQEDTSAGRSYVVSGHSTLNKDAAGSNPNGVSVEGKKESETEAADSLCRVAVPVLGNAEKSRLYGLYKQATEGPCNMKAPNFWEVVKKVKWEAWNKLGDMTQEEAAFEYTQLFENFFGEYLEAKLDIFGVSGCGKEALGKYVEYLEWKNMMGSYYSGVEDDAVAESDNQLNVSFLNESDESLITSSSTEAEVSGEVRSRGVINQSSSVFKGGDPKFLKSLSLSYISNGYNSSEDVDGGNSDIAQFCDESREKGCEEAGVELIKAGIGKSSKRPEENALSKNNEVPLGEDKDDSSSDSESEDVFCVPTGSIESFLLNNVEGLQATHDSIADSGDFNRINGDNEIEISDVCVKNVSKNLNGEQSGGSRLSGNDSFTPKETVMQLGRRISVCDHHLREMRGFVDSLQTELRSTVRKMEQLEHLVKSQRLVDGQSSRQKTESNRKWSAQGQKTDTHTYTEMTFESVEDETLALVRFKYVPILSKWGLSLPIPLLSNVMTWAWMITRKRLAAIHPAFAQLRPGTFLFFLVWPVLSTFLIRLVVRLTQSGASMMLAGLKRRR
eukprot:Nk52_evm63s485 gene=Nk52_evmTU63s485